MVPVFALISRNVGNQRRTITRERQKQMAVLSVMVEETLSVSGFLLGRVMGRTPTLIEQFAQQSGRLTELTVKSAMTGRCLISAALSFLLARQPFAGWIASAGGPGATRLVQNLFVLSMAYWLMCFYLYSAAADAADGNRRARREALFLALAAIGLISATVAAGSHDHGANFQASDLRDRALGSFYLVADVYLAYALAMALRWTCAYARASQRPLATGLWLAAVGIGAMAASCTIRTVLTVVRWQGSTVPPAVTWASGLIIAMAVPLFLIGVSYPGVATRLAAMRVRRQHRRMYHRLGPLWQMLHEAYPEHSLYRVPAKAWRDHLLPLGMPSVEWFEEQPREYRESVLPPAVRARVAVEAG
ncbi:MAB_1171c family putative transporter, partial [Streptomyces sp. NPDC007162]|uniref:MAB_1171c family putative transporter n=1 Tax=Streptomyces sp. NPDC007162 TaxID=3156917 RepID=UPI00340680F6